MSVTAIRKRMKNSTREAWMGYVFLTPSIIGFALFVAYPFIASIYYSLTDWPGFGAANFVGLENFVYMWTKDPSFLKSLRVTFMYVLLTAPLGLLGSLILAVLLNTKNLFGVKVLRTIYYLPVILPSVATLVLWKFVYQPQYGLFNSILRLVGLPASLWLESEAMALPAIAIVRLWLVGGAMIVLLGGLQSVPAELYEAATVDGASGWRKFRHITLPMISPILFLQLVYSFIQAFQEFNAPAILTNYAGSGGGPNFATYLLAYSIYQNAFNSNLFGYAMAQALVLFLIIMSLSVFVYRYFHRMVYYEAGDFNK